MGVATGRRGGVRELGFKLEATFPRARARPDRVRHGPARLTKTRGVLGDIRPTVISRTRPAEMEVNPRTGTFLELPQNWTDIGCIMRDTSDSNECPSFVKF